MTEPYWTWTDDRDRRIGGYHVTPELARLDARSMADTWLGEGRPVPALYLVEVAADGTRTKVEELPVHPREEDPTPPDLRTPWRCPECGGYLMAADSLARHRAAEHRVGDT